MDAIAVKNYDPLWAENPKGFGPPSKDMLDYCVRYADQPIERTNIIDVGSGNGRYAVAFFNAGYSCVAALEISSVGCQLIQNQIPQCSNFRVIPTDILQYPEAQKFDVVFSSGLLEEFNSAADQVTAVGKLQDMTKPSGLLVMRYCLFIFKRCPENRTDENLVLPLFNLEEWNVLEFHTDPDPLFNAKSTIDDGQNVIRRQTLVAKRKKADAPSVTG